MLHIFSHFFSPHHIALAPPCPTLALCFHYLSTLGSSELETCNLRQKARRMQRPHHQVGMPLKQTFHHHLMIKIKTMSTWVQAHHQRVEQATVLADQVQPEAEIAMEWTRHPTRLCQMIQMNLVPAHCSHTKSKARGQKPHCQKWMGRSCWRVKNQRLR